MTTIRPSTLPILAECSCFVSEPGRDFADAGTDRHNALEAHFKGDDSLLDLLPDEDADGVRWAADYIRMQSVTGVPMEWGIKRTLTLPDFSEMPGTPDLVVGPDVFDLKWRQRDYGPQVAAYAFMVMSDKCLPSVRTHTLFAERQHAEVVNWTDAEAWNAIMSVIADAQSPDKKPNPCDYCGWCAARLTCSALTGRALAVANGREDWELKSYHASEIDSPEEMSKALTLARQVKKWSSAVEFHAKEMVVKRGMELPGFKVQQKRGKQYCTDVASAYNLSGLPQDEFLKACDVRLNSSKKYPDKVGLVDVSQKFHGLEKKATAKRDLLKRLEPVIKVSNPSVSLVSVKGSEEDEED